MIRQHLEMPAHGGLRELERGLELPDRQLLALQREQDPAPNRVGQRAQAIEDGGGGQGVNPCIRMERWS